MRGDSIGAAEMKTRRWVWRSGLMVAASAAVGAGALPVPGAAQSIDNKLVNDPALPVMGNPKGRVSIVEFFDYRCPYCRTMQSVLHEVLAKHDNVRLALREWPIFGGVSILAARVALASNWQGRFPAVHAALFALGRKMDAAGVRQAVEGAGVDMRQLAYDMAARSEELDTALGDTIIMARTLGFQGTPSYIVGRYKAPGALSLRQLEDLVVESSKQ